MKNEYEDRQQTVSTAFLRRYNKDIEESRMLCKLVFRFSLLTMFLLNIYLTHLSPGMGAILSIFTAPVYILSIIWDFKTVKREKEEEKLKA